MAVMSATMTAEVLRAWSTFAGNVDGGITRLEYPAFSIAIARGSSRRSTGSIVACPDGP